MMTLMLGLILAMCAMAAARYWQARQRRERRLQSRLIRALHAEFGRGGRRLFRQRA